MKKAKLAASLAFGAVALGAAVVPAVASAQSSTRVVVERARPNNIVQLGGGVNDFTRGLDSITSPGGAWDLRAIFGVRQLLGVELAYAGALNDLNGTSAAPSDRLLSSAGEALIRLNVGGQSNVIPYVGAGLGLTDTRVVDDSGNTIGEPPPGTTGPKVGGASTDVHVPAAVGLDAFLAERLTLGARFAYKYDFRNSIRSDVAKADIQSWQATARLGMAF